MGARFWELDFLRGTAICMMIVFHFAWDINYLGLADISLYTGFWGLFQKATATLFLALVGAGASISFNRQKKGFAKRTLKRAAKVGLVAALITLVSLVFFPARPILFGILHLVAFSLIATIPLAGNKNASLAAGAAILLAGIFFDARAIRLDNLFWLGVGAPLQALDFFPVIPWMSAVLIGIWAGNFLYPQAKPLLQIDKPQGRGTGIVEWLGRHSLAIYIIHQPILFAGFFALFLVTGAPFPKIF